MPWHQLIGIYPLAGQELSNIKAEIQPSLPGLHQKRKELLNVPISIPMPTTPLFYCAPLSLKTLLVYIASMSTSSFIAQNNSVEVT